MRVVTAVVAGLGDQVGMAALEQGGAEGGDGVDHRLAVAVAVHQAGAELMRPARQGCSAGNLLQDDAGTFGCVVRDKTGIGGGPGDGRVPGRARRSLASLGEIPAGLSRRILREFVTTVVAPAVTGAA
jgi:hypothetical protein